MEASSSAPEEALAAPIVPATLAMAQVPIAQPLSAFVEVEASPMVIGVAHTPEQLAKKNAWTAEEDAVLIRVVAEEGAGHWTKIAAHLPGRMGRQCRERWFNHLAPDVKKGQWTVEEDRLILAAVREHGTKWSQIQKALPGRSDNSIKNRYYSAIRKAQRLEKRSTTTPAVMLTPTTDGASQAATPIASAPSTGSYTPSGEQPVEQQADAAAIGIDMRHASSSGTGAASSPPHGAATSAKRKRTPVAEAAVAMAIPADALQVVTSDACMPPEGEKTAPYSGPTIVTASSFSPPTAPANSLTTPTAPEWPATAAARSEVAPAEAPVQEQRSEAPAATA
jgi:hypothetical protein